MTDEERKAKNAEYQREYRKRNRERIQAYDREYYKQNRERRSVQGARWRKNHREEIREYGCRYRGRHANQVSEALGRYKAVHPERVVAGQKVRAAIVAGELTMGSCSVCGSKVVDAHHSDYSKPLDVVWLCRSHHQALHHKLRHP